MNEEHFTIHLQYKLSGTFGDRKYEELSYPKKSGNVRPHSSNSIEKPPHYSQSSRENAIPFIGTSQLASFKEVRCYVVANLVPRSPAVSVKQSEIWVRD